MASSEESRCGGELTVTVLVPSYRRPELLLRCLDGILAGTRIPDQIVVVLRESDTQSQEMVARWCERGGARAQMLEVTHVTEPGPMAAANAGLKLARGDVVALIDDDCVPTERWLERIMAHYADSEVIGVGGRDIVHHGEEISAEPSRVVGRITWYGRIIGNHHQPAFDEPVQVDHLKGANMSFRREVIPVYDLNLRSGVHHEVDVAFGARAGGGRIIYDPHAAVHHYPAPRWFGHQRDSEDLGAVEDLAHDWAYVMLKHLPPLSRAAFWVFALTIGQHWRYGIVRMLVRLPVEGMVAVRRWRAAMRGLFAARRTLQATARQEKDADAAPVGGREGDVEPEAEGVLGSAAGKASASQAHNVRGHREEMTR